MSAIVGIYNINREPVYPEHISGMMKALQKFPADDIKIWHKENMFLGCHAQWITPESIGELLPFYDNERRCTITVDAFIDNREELFEKLQVEKAKRKTMPDSQLILQAYYKWGRECPKYLVGDFAFIIWDGRNQTLFGARDFSGTRTLYYYHGKGHFAFCTVIQPLLTLPFIKSELNEQWLAEYLAIPSMLDSVDVTSTVYKNIKQIPPNHSFLIDYNNLSFSRYSSLLQGDTLKLKSNQEYEEAFRHVFGTAVKSKLRTYKNVGTHLSGGLDSGSIASFSAKALKQEKKQLYTFSYVPVNDFIDWTPKRRLADERPLIKSTVQYVGNIVDHYLSAEKYSPLSEIDYWLDTMEIPYKFFENSYWLKGINEIAYKNNIGVLLNGARGNWSISWGPAMDYYASLLKKMKWIRLYNELNQYGKNTGIKKSRLLSIVGRKAFPVLNRNKPGIETSNIPKLINSGFAQKNEVFQKLMENGIDITGALIPNSTETRLQHFKHLYSWSNTGTSGSKLSLRYSLRDSDPTNDIRVIRFCLSVPMEQYVQNGLDRALVRRSTENYLPDDIRLNQQTRGIQGADGIHRMVPFWDSYLKELTKLREDQIIKEFINMEVIDSAITKFRDGPKTQFVYDQDFRNSMRSLIVYRFLRRFA